MAYAFMLIIQLKLGLHEGIGVYKYLKWGGGGSSCL